MITYGYLEKALNKEIPIFVTEWGTTMGTGNDGFFLEYSNAFVKIMENYNLSWCNYQLSDYNFRVGMTSFEGKEYSGIVQHNKWNNSLSEDILTASGKYIKSILQGNCSSYNNEDYAIIKSRDDNSAFWQEKYRNKIKKINFISEKDVPIETIEEWDVSALLKNTVKAYIVPDKENVNMYELYIISKQNTCLPNNANRFLADFENVESIYFENLKTDNVVDIRNLFENDYNLVNIEGITNWNTEQARWTTSVFKNCSKLQEIDLNGWDVSNVEQMQDMFYMCTSLLKVNAIGWDTSKTTTMQNMFNNCNNLKEIVGIENWNTRNVTITSGMFQQCYNIESLNLENWNLDNLVNMNYMFYSTNNLKELHLDVLLVQNISNYGQLFDYTNFNLCIYVNDLNTAEFISNRLIEADRRNVTVYYKVNDNWNIYI